MMNVFNAIVLQLPIKLAGDLVEIVEAAPLVEILTYTLCLAMAAFLLIGLSALMTHSKVGD